MKKIGLCLVLAALAGCADTCECAGIYASKKLVVPPTLDVHPTADELKVEADNTKKLQQKAIEEKI